VVSTVVPITLFTRAVAGDCAQVTPLLPANVGPHDFQARPADLAAVARARLLVKNGLGLEGFLDKLVQGAANPSLQVIDASRGIAPLALTASPHQEAPSHDETHPAEESGREGEHLHLHGEHGAANPHVWLDPQRAQQQVATIRDGLIAADPACAPSYRRRAAAALARLQQLDQQLAASLRPFRGRTLVVAHDFAPYLAQRYGLRTEQLVVLPEQSPSPADLQRLAAVVRRERLQALLTEPQQGSRSLRALAADLGIRVASFDPLETLPASEVSTTDPLAVYLKVMERNGRAVVGSFQPPS